MTDIETNLIQEKEPKKIKKDETRRTYRFRVPKTKFELIRAILERWWYGMADWPPKTNYNEKLKEKKLRLISLEDWNLAPEVENGLIKVKKVENYKGIFQNTTGKLYDLRVEEGKPSFNNMKKKDNLELAILLKKCIEGQIKVLEKSDCYEINLNYALRKFHKRFLKAYKNIFAKNEEN